VTVFSSWATAAVVGWMACWLYPNEKKYVGWLAALIYLTLGEVAFWYGWLGYLDASFGLFIFASIAALWRALEHRNLVWFMFAMVLISIAFLIKNITAFALLGAAGLVLMARLQRWDMLKNPMLIVLSLMALSVPSLWQMFAFPNQPPTQGASLHDIMSKFTGYSIASLLNHWLMFPLLFLGRSLPISLLLIWLYIRHKQKIHMTPELTTVAWVILACFLPFWLSPGAGARYLIPLYGWVALLLTGMILSLNASHLKQALRLMVIILLIKIPYSLWILPYIKDDMPERSIKAVATEIMMMTREASLRTQSDVANGLSIAAYLDVWQQNKPPIHWYDGKEKGVYILAEDVTPSFGTLVKKWHLRGRFVYLYYQE